MVGFAGSIQNSPKRTSSILIKKMLESMKYTEYDLCDKWNDDFFTITKVYHMKNQGLQPIFNEDKSLGIVMNGEIFDYEDEKVRLMYKGHVFNFSKNDAEYCLHLYEEKGAEAFKEFNGSFCIVLYNLDTHELFLVNDRFSSQPVYYHLAKDGTLFFATDLPPLLQSPKVSRELDIISVYELFTFQQLLGTKTIFKNIRSLPPATFMHYRSGTISLTPYWEKKYKDEIAKHPEKYYINKFVKAIKESINRRTRGNYRFGILLSGGLDSRTVLAASDKKMVAFTVGDFKDHQEVKFAKKIADTKGVRHFFLKRDLDYYANHVDEAVQIGNCGNSFIHAHYLGFIDQIRRECDVLFHGWGIGSLFKGDLMPKKTLKLFGKKIEMPYLLDLSNYNLCEKILRNFKYGLYEKNPRQLFTPRYSHLLREYLTRNILQIIKEAENKTIDPYNKWEYVFINSFSNIISFLNISSIRPFITERSIAFDNDLFNVYLEMPPRLRFGGKILKKALKKLNNEIAKIPGSHTGFSPFTQNILSFIIKQILIVIQYFRAHNINPIFTYHSWQDNVKLIKYNEKMRRLIYETINDEECLNQNIFNNKRINEMFKEHIAGKANYTGFLMLLLTLGRWHKKYVFSPKSMLHRKQSLVPL